MAWYSTTGLARQMKRSVFVFVFEVFNIFRRFFQQNKSMDFIPVYNISRQRITIAKYTYNDDIRLPFYLVSIQWQIVLHTWWDWSTVYSELWTIIIFSRNIAVEK